MAPGGSRSRKVDLTLRSLGAASTVTGSKHLLEAEGKRILVDCGEPQPADTLRMRLDHEFGWQATIPTTIQRFDL